MHSNRFGPRRARKGSLFGCLAIGLAITGALSVQAGGYLSVSGTTPRAWSGTVTVRLDLGTLGSLNNTDARNLSNAALAEWSSGAISTCSLSFSEGAQLASDQTGANYTTLYDNFSDGITPIMFDTDGSITDAELGSGASSQVLGFAGPHGLSGNTIVEGHAVLNGRFIDGAGSPADVTQTQFQGVIAHEYGHMLNLDHAQFNEAFLNASSSDLTSFPTMFPQVHGDIDTLETDDKVWISSLYPSGSFSSLSTITGTTRNSSAVAFSGANIVARKASNPKEAISCVAGYLGTTGEYMIPGVPADDQWFLHVEEVRAGWTGGSRVGPFTPVTLPGVQEFINESGQESNSDDARISTVMTSASAGGTLSGVNVTMNGTPALSPVAEVDAGATFTASAQTLNITPGTAVRVSGTAAESETGNIAPDTVDDFEDWYFIPATPGLDVYRIVLTPTAADLDLIVVRATGGAVIAFPYETGAAPEVYSDSLNTELGGGVYIGVSNYDDASVPTDNYTLDIYTGPSINSAMLVTGVSGTAPGTLTISGRNFSNTGGAPTVAFSDGNLTHSGVTFVNSTTLTVNASVGGTVTNPVTVAVTNQSGSGAYGSRLSTNITVSGASEADLGLAIGDSVDPVAPGGQVTYTFTVTNNGPDQADSVTVTDLVPAAFNFASNGSPSVGSYSSGTDTWTIGNMANSAVATLTVTVDVPGALGDGPVTNAAIAASTTTDSTPGNNQPNITTTVSAAASVRDWSVLE